MINIMSYYNLDIVLKLLLYELFEYMNSLYIYMLHI